jgi:arabinan endo-1,5-alpha-L-arabinosidase
MSAARSTRDRTRPPRTPTVGRGKDPGGGGGSRGLRKALVAAASVAAVILPSLLVPVADAAPPDDEDGVQQVIDRAVKDASSDLEDDGAADADQGAAADDTTAGQKSASTGSEDTAGGTRTKGLGDMSVPGPATITNPISSPFADTYADPSILRGHDGYYYAYATSDPLRDGDEPGDMHVARTKDFSSWEYEGTVFDGDNRPEWAAKGSHFWAPDVRYINGKYAMYYTVTDSAAKPGEDMSIGMATAPTPTGPWTDSGGPVVESRVLEKAAEDADADPAEAADDSADNSDADEPPSYQGLIDPALFADDDGSLYLYLGGFAGGPQVTRLSDDGTKAKGDLHQVASTDRYEGSFVVRHGKYYYLMLSAANCCGAASSGYSVFAGRSESPMGPFVDQDGNPLLDSRSGGTQVLASNGNKWVGVGHHAVFSDTTGQDWILYHGIDRNDSWLNEPGGINKRPMLVDKLDWIDDWPVVNEGKGASDQPVPGPTTGTALGIASDDPASGKALTSLSGSFRSTDDTSGDAGAVGALRPAHHLPAVATSRQVVHGNARIETDLRLADKDGNVCARVDGLLGGTRVCLDGARGELSVRPAHGRTATTSLPARVDPTQWHTLVVTADGGDVRAELQESRLEDPVAVAETHGKGTHAAWPRAGLLSLTSTRSGADLDNLSVAPLATAPAQKVADPEVGKVTGTESFDGSLADVEDRGWTLQGKDPGMKVSGGKLSFPLTDHDVGGDPDQAKGAPLLLHDAPDGDWVMDADMHLDVGQDTVRDFQQAGLIVYGDDDQFVRLSSVALGTSRVMEFYKRDDADGEVVGGGHQDGPTAKDMTLRIMRTHNDDGEQIYRSAFSTDGGKTWKWGMTWTLPEGTDVQVGLQAGGGAKPATNAVFDEVRFRDVG